MDQLVDRIFQNHSEQSFNDLALDIYQFQIENNHVYRNYIQLIGQQKPKIYTEIPFLPISFFKTHKVLAEGRSVEKTFRSSGTTQSVRSSHLVHQLSIYENSFTIAYEKLFGNPKEQVILALLPNYLEQGSSSLVYMVKKLIQLTKNQLSGFVLENTSSIIEHYQQAINQNKEVVIFGVSYALLDLAEQKVDLSKARIIETGGMKGRRKEMTKKELHEAIQKGTNVISVSSEYGMTELLSQAYSLNDGLFNCPPWMKILLRDVKDPLSSAPKNKTGAINVIDLANLYSCSFIATDDLGKTHDSQFEIMGRLDLSDIRGCNLMVQ